MLSLLFPWLLAAVVLPCMAGEIDDTRRELDELQERIQLATRRLQGQGETERALTTELQEVDEAQRLLEKRIGKFNRQLQQLDRELARAEQESQQVAVSISLKEAAVRQRLTTIYRQGSLTPWRLMLSGESPRRLAQDLNFQERIARRDRDLLQDFRKESARQQQLLQSLSTMRQDQARLIEQRIREHAVLAEAAALKGTVLARVRKERSRQAAELTELQQQAKELAALLKRLESTKSPDYSKGSQILAEQKGHLPWPAVGRVRTGFGTSRDKELGTLYQSQGIELQVAPQQPVVAVWAGKVVFADHFKGYGQLLILEHGGGYFTLYAQVNRLSKRVGEMVAQGEVLAFPGGKEHDRLYFEIRKGGIPLNPEEWLESR